MLIGVLLSSGLSSSVQSIAKDALVNQAKTNVVLISKEAAACVERQLLALADSSVMTMNEQVTVLFQEDAKNALGQLPLVVPSVRYYPDYMFGNATCDPALSTENACPDDYGR